MKKILVAGAFALASLQSYAADIESIMVVHDAAKDPVRLDYRSNDVVVQVLDLGYGAALDEKLTAAVTAGMRIPENITEAEEDRFEEEVNARFSEYAQSDAFRTMQAEMMAWGEQVAQLAALQITQAPAVVINGSYVVYGERSVSSAVETYYAKVN